MLAALSEDPELRQQTSEEILGSSDWKGMVLFFLGSEEGFGSTINTTRGRIGSESAGWLCIPSTVGQLG